ncbi:MAG: hypothetical protein QXX17_02335 [Conexivisphaerales archaeon]
MPARTTKVVTVGGVLKREEMDLVLNPHDRKAIEAADFVRRRVGGKVIGLTMGPDFKLQPILSQLYDVEVFGMDEAYILSDPKMAGADTLATAYTLGLGVKKVIDIHLEAIDSLAKAGKDAVLQKAKQLYEQNLIPNWVYSSLPSIRSNLVSDYVEGRIDSSGFQEGLRKARDEVMNFIVLAGIKTTDGETGSVGPQVAEALSELFGFELPHATYVDDFDIEPSSLTVFAERKMGRLVQKLQLLLPAVLTINSEFRPKPTSPSAQIFVRSRSYMGKVRVAKKYSASDIGADPSRLGLAGSPTIVGPGIDIGKPPVQKFLGKSLVFLERVEKLSFDGKEYPAFERGDLASDLPERLLQQLKEKGLVGTFDFDMLMEELFGR